MNCFPASADDENFVSLLCLIFALFSSAVGILYITDMSHTAWQQDPQSGTKQRVVNYTMPLSQSVGPKSSQVTETQVRCLLNLMHLLPTLHLTLCCSSNTVPHSDVGQDSNYPDWYFSWFSFVPIGNSRIVPWQGVTASFQSFPLHFSLIILSFNASLALTTSLLSKPQIKWSRQCFFKVECYGTYIVPPLTSIAVPLVLYCVVFPGNATL